MTQLIPCESGGTATREGGLIGPMAGVIEVGMPELDFVDVFWKDGTGVQGGLRANDVDNSLSKGF